MQLDNATLLSIFHSGKIDAYICILKLPREKLTSFEPTDFTHQLDLN